ncbi:MAG: hypothetical protein AAGH65_02535, partial [Pseudomonadota bacterium]
MQRLSQLTTTALLMLILAASAQAQWPVGIGSSDTDEVVVTKVSPLGDVYVAGHFSGALETPLGTFVSNGLQDIFVARIGPSGQLIWLETAGGTSVDTVNDITIDNGANIYLAGEFFGTINFGGSSLTANGSLQDGFVARIDVNGDWKWARRISGAETDRATSVAALPGDQTVIPPVPNSVIVVGSYECSAQFQDTSSTPINLTNGNCADGRDLFVARYSESGSAIWAVDRGSSASGRESLDKIEIDENGRAWLIGEFAEGGTVTRQSNNFNNGSLGGWTSSDGARGLVSPTSALGVSFFNGNGALALRGGTVTITSPVIDTSNSSIVRVFASALHGFDQGPVAGFNFEGFLTEYPEAGENLQFRYLNSSDEWVTVQTLSGGGNAGQRFDFTGTNSIQITNANALHSGFRFQFRLTRGDGFFNGPFGTYAYDWWHVDDVTIQTTGRSRPLVLSMNNLLDDNTPTFGQSLSLDRGLDVRELAIDETANRVLIAGSGTTGAQIASCTTMPANGAFVASLSRQDLSCVWSKSTTGGVANDITVDDDPDLDGVAGVYLTGTFNGQIDFAADLSLQSANNSDDVFIVKYDGNGQIEWATGGGELNDDDTDPNFGIPAFAGSFDNDAGLSIDTDGFSTLYVGGLFRSIANFGPVDTLTALGDTDGFVINLGIDGFFFQEQSWIAGVALTPPPTAKIDDVAFQPDFELNGQPFDAIGSKIFSWSRANGQDARLIPLQPFGAVDVRWRVEGQPPESDARVTTSGSISWPNQPCDDVIITECFQVHVVGAPVTAEPASGDFKILEVVSPDSGSSNPEVNTGLFTADRTGTASIVYVNGPSVDPLQFPTVVEIVRTLPYTAVPLFVDAVEVEIGQPIVDPFHNEPNRNGWVVNENGFYDGFGPDAAYNRAGRTGQIIPVNRYSTTRPQDQGNELGVAWYRANAKGVFWPAKAVRYLPRWPFDPDRIIIASELGGEVLGQQPLDPLLFPSARLYIQNDPSLPGYNPNDEHAILAPSSTGTGFESVFALRSDFGAALENDTAAASDPYVLLKYFDDAILGWRFRIYRVDATGAGFNQFRYTGTAATTVAPPYPLSILTNCAETFVEGQAVGEQPPPPFFQDYSSQLWAKSAGSGVVQYFYPAQPGFFTDLDNNDANDIIGQACQPWLARLPEDQGGTASIQDPIKVGYDITWPAQRPLLVAGETLLTPKRGLPDIFNQAAVEVVYDEIQETQTDPAPSDTLVQLIDPLNPRFVFLDEIPGAVATELQTDGTEAILGSSDTTIKLPVSVRDRIRYDALNNRLTVDGIFDETGAGDPFLLLNVLSKRDRVVLKTLDGGDGSEATSFTNDCSTPSSACSWDQAIEALFRLSRNPQGIESICTSSRLDDNRERICEQSRAVTEDDVLIGLQDANNDSVLEPFQAVGVNAALTAGFSQGSGLLTVAFNNDASLAPLPVSLEVIQVGCFESPEGPDGPEILAPFQGQINVLSPENIFDEQLVLRHGGDFGGNPDALEFQWFFQPDNTGSPPALPPDPENGQLNGWIQFPVEQAQGAVEISIEGANIRTLSDNWYLARYRGLPGCNNQVDWSLWAGSPGGTPRDPLAQLAEGWVKRVLGRLNPFEARVQNFAQAATNNYASMLIQLGERYEGPIALNNDPDNLNSIGLIEAYTTVLRRALQLSVDGTPPVNFGPANNAILLVASRLVEFYTLLGNEAFADAQDPTIGITTNNGTFSLAPSIFNFQNQLASLLDEELVLLRGRDTTNGPVTANPVYNRLFWNFTTGDGEVAYAQSYNISDQNFDGVIDEFDARIQFPQGHGDAWGHYLTAGKIYYELLRNPFYSWDPRTEAIAVAGVPIEVDFEDERQFTETAAAKAKTGAELVDLTYRSQYVEDPAGQFQGYTDTDPERAWGLSEWGRRAGMGAYFDWVTANSILPPEELDPTKVGIRQIDRRSIAEIGEIASHYDEVQGQVDKADAGLNPLGLATGVVPFDIDVSQLDRFNKTQFEQVADRAIGALENAVNVWDYANELTNQMRRNQNEVDDLARDSRAQETDFSNQLIEIFGYPYADDIGPGGTYPAGYDGPDLYNYMLVDVPQLAGTLFDFDGGLEDFSTAKINSFTANYAPSPNGVNFFNLEPQEEGTATVNDDGIPCANDPLSQGCALGALNTSNDNGLQVEYTTIESPDIGFWFTKPEEWTGQRRAPGEIQQILQQMLQARIALRQSLLEYDKLRLDIEAEIGTLQSTFNLSSDTVNIAVSQRNTLQDLTIATEVMKNTAIVARRVGEFTDFTFNDVAECVPKSLIAGLAAGGDIASTARCTIKTSGNVAKLALDTVADGLDIAANATDAAKEDVSELAGINTLINDTNLALFDVVGVIDELIRREPILRSEVFARTEAIKQLVGDYQAAVADGLRVFDRLLTFRRAGAAEIQEYRYQDLAFRVFRNEALQKYRAAFDLASRYVYLAAAAYDYETNLLGTDSQAGQEFLTNIVRQRSLGQLIAGEPLPGTPGLADSMAQLQLNFDVLKGQMGFNNPQVETNRFSLRNELFRIPDGPDGDLLWRQRLEEARVDDLWQLQDFRQYARPFAPQSAGPQPALVIDFTTNVTFGLNYFGWELGSGDSSYDSSQFATRIRSVGTWFDGYDSLPLAQTPRIYLFPTGADVLRAPSANDFTTREWQIVDQAIPIPFPVGQQDLDRFDWLPITDNISGSPNELRRYGRFQAYSFTEPFDDSQVIADSRLVGRSVWNRRWLMIIPGGTFLADPDEGLEIFINGQPIPGGSGRDG